MRALSRWLDQRPLLAVWLGFVVAFLIMCAAEPFLMQHLDQPAHSRGNT